MRAFQEDATVNAVKCTRNEIVPLLDLVIAAVTEMSITAFWQKVRDLSVCYFVHKNIFDGKYLNLVEAIMDTLSLTLLGLRSLYPEDCYEAWKNSYDETRMLKTKFNELEQSINDSRTSMNCITLF